MVEAVKERLLGRLMDPNILPEEYTDRGRAQDIENLMQNVCYSDYQYYAGDWVDGKPHGYGIAFRTIDEILHGYFDHGTFK